MPPSDNVLRDEALKKALAPKPDPMVVRRQRLDQLFARLENAREPADARPIAESIEAIWRQSGSTTADLLMQRVEASLGAGHYPLALALLGKILALEPDWVEAWSRRAGVRVLADDTDGAMADIDRVLKLEPRHFGALAAMGAILEQAGLESRALEVLRRALAIYPAQPDLQDRVERLTIRVEGRGI